MVQHIVLNRKEVIEYVEELLKLEYKLNGIKLTKTGCILFALENLFLRLCREMKQKGMNPEELVENKALLESVKARI